MQRGGIEGQRLLQTLTKKCLQGAERSCSTADTLSHVDSQQTANSRCSGRAEATKGARALVTTDNWAHDAT